MIKKLSAIIMLALSVMMLCSCASKTAKTTDEFTSFMKDKGFTVDDATADTETNGLAKSVLIAHNSDFQIEFYALTDNETGEGVFYNNKNIFDEEVATKKSSTELTTGSYNYYSFIGDDSYYMIARIDDTMLYCVADKEYKDAIDDLVNELGY